MYYPTFYRGTIGSVLTSCITVWYGNCSSADRKTLQRTVNTAAKIICAPLPSILDIFLTRCSSKANREVSWRTLPILPTVSSSSNHQDDGHSALEPAPPDCSTAFSPRLWEPWTQLTPSLSEIPFKLPIYWNMDHPPHPPTLPYQRKKLSNFFVQFKVLHTGKTV